ncbi:MAG: methionine--tRNA ligase subunit beta [Candidatus Vogelbacteria bacterium]|nr:methionine--tRNA ligase subunit beta [Candidatus Vogelbacteria bacterium]
MTISYDEWQKMELKIGQIVAAERVEGSDKLLKMQVDLGEETPRQIIAGIGKAYEPETLIGRELLFIANLEPRTIMGLESQGMVLAASDEQGPIILTPDRPVAPGAALK